MSATATRLDHARARTVADALTARWGLGTDCLWCGSLRRRSPTVGDLDLVAALPDGRDDPLFERIDATIEKSQEQLGMFVASPDKPIGVAIKGHKPHFRAAYYDLRTTWTDQAGQPITAGVNAWRHQPGNKGWTIIRCTGPDDFVIMFLDRWKMQHGIQRGEEHRASIEGHLVDRYGVAIPTESEEDAFRLAGWAFIQPHDRERVAQHWARRAATSSGAPSRQKGPP